MSNRNSKNQKLAQRLAPRKPDLGLFGPLMEQYGIEVATNSGGTVSQGLALDLLVELAHRIDAERVAADLAEVI